METKCLTRFRDNQSCEKQKNMKIITMVTTVAKKPAKI